MTWPPRVSWPKPSSRIADVIDNNTKLVVFAMHRKMIDQVYQQFKTTAVKIAGDVPGEAIGHQTLST